MVNIIELGKAIFSGYNQFLIDKVLSGDEVLLPNRFGSLHIKGVKPRRTLDGTISHPINWPETIKFWNKYPEKKKAKVTIKYLNSHTDGYTYSFRWGKKGVFAKNKTVYYFKVTKCNRKALSEKITFNDNIHLRFNHWGHHFTKYKIPKARK